MTDKQEYKGVSNGFHGKITATVTLEGDKITSVNSEHAPEAFVGNLGIQRMITKMTDQNTTEVDTITGATFSSQAFKKAAQKAVAVSNDALTEVQAMDPNTELEVPETDTVSSASVHEETEAAPENTSMARELVDEDDVIFDNHFDVVVVGSGGAGLAAAVESARGGLSVLICEKAGIAGGTTNYSGGVFQAAGTKYQEEFGGITDDTAEKHAELWLKAGEGQLDEDLVRDLANQASGNLDWLADMGIEWTGLYGHAHIPYVDPDLHKDRIHSYDSGGGSGSGVVLTQTLLTAALEAGAQIAYDTPVVSLVQSKENKAIVGVGIVDPDGNDKYLLANKGVVLATASIDHNEALAKDLHPQQYHDLKHNTVLTAKTDTGDGLVMGMTAGGTLTGVGGAIDFDGKTGNATNNQIPTMPLIFVNGQGQRFVCEDATYAYQYRAIFQQEKQHDAPTYMIFDGDSIQAEGSAWTEDSLAAEVASGLVQKAESIEELAQMIDVPVENLKETLSVWNSNAVDQVDPVYDRQMGIQPLSAPFYAYQNKASNLGSIGGLKINVDCQVLDVFNKPISGLYAAGLNAGGWIGGYYPGSGTAISGIVHQGRRAAQAILK